MAWTLTTLTNRLTDAHRGREGVTLPALRTVRAVFPHTALQSVVSSSGVSRVLPGRVKREQPGIGEEGVGPEAMVIASCSESGPMGLPAQDRPQPSADELVEHDERAGMRVLEVAEPAAQCPIEISDDSLEAVPALSSRLRSDRIFDAMPTLLANKPPPSFEPITEELKPLPRCQAVADMRFVRMQTQAVLCHPSTDFRQGSVGLFSTPTEHYKVVRIAHHPIPAGRHQFIERVQVDVRQQRADDRTLRRALRRRPSLQVAHDVLLEPAAQQVENAPITDALLNPLHQPLVRDGVEVALEVGVDHVDVAIRNQLSHLAQRIPAAPSRPKAVTGRSERRLEDRLKRELHCRLDDTILDRRDAQRSRPAVALRNLDPPDRLRTVIALPQSRRKLGQVHVFLRFEPLDAFAIHSRRAIVGQDSFPGRLQRRGRVHLVHQTVPVTSFDAVFQRRHHAVRPDRSFHPRLAMGFCTLFSPDGHCRCFRLLPSVHPASTFLPAFPRHSFAIRAFRRSSPLQYYAGSDPCRASPARQVSPFHLFAFRTSRPQPRRAPERHVLVTSFVRSVPCGPRLRHLWAGSPQHAAESGSSSYGLSLRLQLLPTPPRSDANTPPLGDAVAFGYICDDFTWHGL